MKRVLSVLLVGVVALGVTTPADATRSKPKATKPRAAFFGMHYGAIGYDNTYPGITAIGSLRLWDTGTLWRDIQPRPDAWDWTVLDRAVSNAHQHGATVSYVFGGAPDWAAQDPQTLEKVGGAPPPRDEQAWVDFVSAVATRYRGRIAVYEPWNEVNIGGYYGGTMKQMLRLCHLAYTTIKRIDPKAIVTGPSTTIRGATGTPWQVRFARSGGFRWADVVNVHLYPYVDGTPEDMARMARRFRAAMLKVGVHKPIWNTEINYGQPQNHRTRKRPLTENQQAAWVVRNYLLGWSSGLARSYWYAWSNAEFLGIKMTGPDGRTPSAGARGFSTARHWMNGRMTPCTVNRAGTYRCAIAYRRGTGVAVWNPRKTVTIAAPRRTTARQDVFRRTVPTRGGRKVRIGYSPVLFLQQRR